MPGILERRVEMLEKTVGGPGGLVEQVAALRADLSDLRTQFLAFRDYVIGEFSAVRREIKAECQAVRDELRAEIRAGLEETRREMRILHEDVVARIGLLQEGLNGRRAANRRGRKKR